MCKYNDTDLVRTIHKNEHKKIAVHGVRLIEVKSNFVKAHSWRPICIGIKILSLILRIQD